jgi:hypothetical protein
MGNFKSQLKFASKGVENAVNAPVTFSHPMKAEDASRFLQSCESSQFTKLYIERAELTCHEISLPLVVPLMLGANPKGDARRSDSCFPPLAGEIERPQRRSRRHAPAYLQSRGANVRPVASSGFFSALQGRHRRHRASAACLNVQAAETSKQNHETGDAMPSESSDDSSDAQPASPTRTSCRNPH